jgi:hypothetical protein
MRDAKSDSSRRLAQLTQAVTMIVTTAWRSQQRMGENIGAEVRDAVITLVTERSPRAKFQMVVDRPELSGLAAERLLDHAAGLCRTLPGVDASYARFFESHMDMVRDALSGEIPASAVPVEPLADEVREEVLADMRSGAQSARDHDRRARELRDRGQIEEAVNEFAEAIRRARSEDDPATEGDAELGLFVLVMRTAKSAPDGHRRMMEHARRAVDAYRRAGDQIGERDATVALITVLTDQGDRSNLDAALIRLARLNEDYARWWRAYAAAMHSTQLDDRVSGLRWCVEHAHLLDDHADFYGKMCAGKLAFYEDREDPLDQPDADMFQGAIMAASIFRKGSTEAIAAQLDELLNKVEQSRKYARSQALQRELSDVHQLAYLAAVKCAEEIRGPEAAVDVNELASSRALLAQTGMHQLWRQMPAQVWENARPTALQRLLGRFMAAPTDHHRGLLLKSFATHRTAQQHQERRVLSTVPGFTTVAPPIATEAVRALLADDQRIVVYSRTGSIFLVARDECRVIGRIRADDHLAAAALRARELLSDPTADSAHRHDAISWLMTELVQPVLDHTPEGARVFLVPSPELWRIPLWALDPDLLATNREVSYVPSLTVLARLLTTRRLTRNLERFVGLGDPDGSLPYARAEIDHAASTFADSLIVLGDRLDYHVAMANLADADVAHLGCHGMFFPEYPDFSALHLAGPREQPQVLWQGELGRYELNARLVVLAACHAGTGATKFGSEYVGFPGAFLAAGARGVLAPLWAVSDASTEVLMRHFYTALSRFASPAAALREAQRLMAADEATAHPYHWAGFQLFGVAPAFSPIEAA